jgi:hypothetical protein
MSVYVPFYVSFPGVLTEEGQSGIVGMFRFGKNKSGEWFGKVDYGNGWEHKRELELLPGEDEGVLGYHDTNEYMISSLTLMLEFAMVYGYAGCLEDGDYGLCSLTSNEDPVTNYPRIVEWKKPEPTFTDLKEVLKQFNGDLIIFGS